MQAATPARRALGFAVVALVTALFPTAYDRAARRVAARQIYFSAWQVLPGFTLVSMLLSYVLIHIVLQTAQAYGLSEYALEMTVRVLVLELIPLFAALFVALRSGAAINTEVALMHIRGELDALTHAGAEPLRHELMPRVVGSVVAVTLLSFLNCALALALTYYAMYGLSPWGWGEFVRVTGAIFGPIATLALAFKTLLFGAAVAVIPISAALATPRELRSAPIAVLRGMVRLMLVLALIEGSFLSILYS